MEVEKAAFAATWRDEETGEIVAYTLGDTMCQSPRRPWALTIEREGDRLIAPCGECSGCLEFLRRRLAERLKAKYSLLLSASSGTTTNVAAGNATAGATYSGKLWLIRIWYPLELQAELSRKLHRRRGLELEPGFYRLGVDSFAVLARSKEGVPPLLRRLGLRHHVEPVRLSRGRRAFRLLTSGILVARAVYGCQVKRWYARGLPPAERLKWDVVKKAMQKPWRRRTGARVRSGGKIILVPPAIWSMGGDRIAEFRKESSTAITPEQVLANRRRVAEIVTSTTSAFQLDAPAQPALTREQVRAFYVSMAQRKTARASATPVAALSPSTLLGRGLRSSLHSPVADEAATSALELETWLHSGAPPPSMGRERDYEDWLDECWSDGRTRRAIIEARMAEERAARVDGGREKFARELASWVERMKGKIRGG